MLEYPVYIHMPTEESKPYLENRSAAEAVINAIINAQADGWVRLHGFVVLPAALELIISPIRQGISGVVAHLQAETLPILSVLKPEAFLFWSQHYQHATIETQKALNERIEKMELSPVAAGLCVVPEAYPFSSANPRYQGYVQVIAGFTPLLPPDEDALRV
ncbi:MAG: hypothetical protein Kow00117_11520 [Phototrophicales bacterium]